jgi:hypothetical protein
MEIYRLINHKLQIAQIDHPEMKMHQSLKWNSPLLLIDKLASMTRQKELQQNLK